MQPTASLLLLLLATTAWGQCPTACVPGLDPAGTSVSITNNYLLNIDATATLGNCAAGTAMRLEIDVNNVHIDGPMTAVTSAQNFTTGYIFGGQESEATVYTVNVSACTGPDACTKSCSEPLVFDVVVGPPGSRVHRAPWLHAANKTLAEACQPPCTPGLDPIATSVWEVPGWGASGYAGDARIVPTWGNCHNVSTLFQAIVDWGTGWRYTLSLPSLLQVQTLYPYEKPGMYNVQVSYCATQAPCCFVCSTFIFPFAVGVNTGG